MRRLVGTIIATVFLVFGVAATTASAEKHEVEKGDNLWNIAQEYDTTVKKLIEINELATTVIQPKQLILINDIYIVEKEDTLLSIGKKFDVTTKDIKEWNDLESDIIVVGQELEIHGLHDNEEDEAEVEAEEELATKEQASEKVTESNSNQSEEKTENSSEGKTISVSATAYTAKCEGCSGVTYTGVDLNANPNAKVIAVDPNVIPLGSEVYVEGYGDAIAADIGGAIKGNKIDIHVPTKQEAFSWGVRTVNVTIK